MQGNVSARKDALISIRLAVLAALGLVVLCALAWGACVCSMVMNTDQGHASRVYTHTPAEKTAGAGTDATGVLKAGAWADVIRRCTYSGNGNLLMLSNDEAGSLAAYRARSSSAAATGHAALRLPLRATI